MTSTRFIEDPETLVSNGSAFKLGFFSLADSTNRYVGIWYSTPSLSTVIWVANRDKPLNDSSGIVTISEDGNLQVMNGQKEIVWSSYVSNASANSSAQLLDSGNLVLQDNSGRITWESIQHPSHSLLPKMKISTNTNTGEKVVLTSWKSPSDPSIGSFSLGMNPLNIPKYSSGMAVIHIGEVVHGAVRYLLEYPTWIQFSAVDFSCLRGYKPKYTEEWSRGNWTSGCVRKTPLQCERTNSSGQQGKIDGFFRLTTVKVPDYADWSLADEDECREECLKNCSCIAYSYYSGIGCMTWSGSLIDLQQFTKGRADLYIRLAHSELDKKRDMKAIISVTIVVGTIALPSVHISYGVKEKSKEILPSDRGDAYQNYDMNMLGDNVNRVKLEELPLLDFEKLAAATNNFHEANKLGQGGFGPVYRGNLPGGQEIAVKRLSRASAQGQEEFMNEMILISKIQHRNLVRLLGFCIEGDEKLLIYEYMPNKSLDAFLFDLNAKISDFGMARIFGSNQDQANTMRVVGTYGYMSPEYAMGGQFSEKSDVFSFGVLLLETVSGRRNTSFQYDDQYMSLLGYAWTLWCEHNIQELIVGAIADACFQEEISRCIHVGLLCVQESAKDRPSMSTVLSMLSSEIAHLPPPKQPPFLEKQIAIDTESSQPRQNESSSNQVTVTIIQGR
ncbi:G-type lectin S-receptor-like serine/threonine-protein kinase [Vitis vinifera]|uniref:G-type lectin S-receptor-like serine/threonine-protein kinase n=1 Tax=Vitis vinifera TaxID=29760 RepID=A0A438BSI7_VITVI|nr:G-type lectin S-receptor-like serine/threonine-protein kinase [Vitis vinifera]